MFSSASVKQAVLTLGAAAALMLFAQGASGSITCSQCHGAWIDHVSTRSVLHSPFAGEECESCHRDHGKTNELTLTSESTELCLGCHLSPGDGSLAHVPDKKACLSCHDPHGSRGPGLTRKPFTDLCLECHGTVVKASYVHRALSEKGCGECHTPHSSSFGMLLKSEQSKICNSCHAVLNGEENAHTALVEYSCTGCHDPHSSTEYRLLKDVYDDRLFPGAYSQDKYSLCFKCHDTFLVTGKDASDTRFRNGEVNLHTVHVVGTVRYEGKGLTLWGRSRSCANCHDPHGAVGPFDLKKYIACTETVCRTLTFFPEPQGGRCLVDCHKSASYNRGPIQP